MAKLTAKQQRFVEEYLIDLNATRAYKVAYPNIKNDETASAAGSRLLGNVNVNAYVKQRMKEREKRTEITQDRVLREYARLGFFDPRKLFNSDGSPKGIEELDDDTAAVLAGLEVMEIYEGREEDREFVGYLKKYKLADKKGALDSMARHLGMFNDKLQLGGDVEIDVHLVDDEDAEG
jgi:phage terminase small subunit